MSSSVHIDDKGKLIIILGERATSETKCSIYFIYSGKRFVLSLHYVESNMFFC